MLYMVTIPLSLHLSLSPKCMPPNHGSVFIFLLSSLSAFTKTFHLSRSNSSKNVIVSGSQNIWPLLPITHWKYTSTNGYRLHPSSPFWVCCLSPLCLSIITLKEDLLLSIKLNAHLLSYKSNKVLFTGFMDHSLSVYCWNVNPLWKLKAAGANRFGLHFMLAAINDQACFLLWKKGLTSYYTHCRFSRFNGQNIMLKKCYLNKDFIHEVKVRF